MKIIVFEPARSNSDVVHELKRALDPKVVRMLPEDLKQHPIDVIDDAKNWCTPLSDPDMKADFLAIAKKHEDIVNKILDALPGEKRCLIEDFSSTWAEMNTFEFTMAFRQGLRDGFRLAKFFEEGGITDKNFSETGRSVHHRRT